MKLLANRFPYTSIAFAMAIVVLAIRVTLGVNVFDLPGLSVVGIERSETGEVAIAFLLIVPAFFIDRVVSRQRGQEAFVQAERLRALQATMRTVQDIVNNALNELQLIRFEAEPFVSPDVLARFDETIHGTAAKLRELGDLKAYVETQMAAGTGISREQR